MRKRKPPVKFSPPTDPRKKPKASIDEPLLPLKRPAMVASTTFSRVEDFNIIKLFLQLGPDWEKIKAQMKSSRTKSSLRDRWVRLQEWYQTFSRVVERKSHQCKAQQQIASLFLQDYQHAVDEAQREYYEADQNGNYL